MSALPPTNGPLVDLRSTYGAILIGVCFSISLLGVLTSQVHKYYNNFEKDPLYLKCIVGYVWFAEALRASLATHGVYYYLVLEWGNPIALANLVWTSQVTLLLSPLIEIAVRLYFGYRIWIVSRNNPFISLLIVLLAFACLAIGVGAFILSTIDTKVTDHTDLLHNFGTAGLALTVTADWTISLSLIYFLNKSRTGLSRTNSIINHIIFYTINMGVITSMMDVVILVLSLWKTPTPTLYFLALYQVVGNLYGNSLLASLNSRLVIRDKDGVVPLSDFSSFAAKSRPQHDLTSSKTIGGSQSSDGRIFLTEDISANDVNRDPKYKEKRSNALTYSLETQQATA